MSKILVYQAVHYLGISQLAQMYARKEIAVILYAICEGERERLCENNI